MLMVTNVAGNNTVRCRFNRAADGSKMAILGSKNMAVGEYVLFTGAEMIMEPGDTITMTPTGSGTVEVDTMATIEEFFTVPG